MSTETMLNNISHSILIVGPLLYIHKILAVQLITVVEG